MVAVKGILSLVILKATALFLLLLMASAPAATASPVKARTLSGIGILLISREKQQITLFREPSLGRIATTDASALPLSQSIQPPAGLIAAVVTARKGGWYRILYDDAEREGWIKGYSSYSYHRWVELLSNRSVILLGGLRKDYYQLRSSPDSSAAALEPVGKGVKVTALRIEEEWLEAVTASETRGWLRWRDENNRLVIAIQL